MIVERCKYILWAADMDRALNFYHEVFGAEITRRSEVISEIEICGAIIGIHGGGEGKRTWTGLSFQVADEVASRSRRATSRRTWRCASILREMILCSAANAAEKDGYFARRRSTTSWPIGSRRRLITSQVDCFGLDLPYSISTEATCG